ncbi:transposase [Parasphingorhabdus pacifica]
MHEALRDQERAAKGRERQPGAGIIDAQAVLTAEGSTQRGYDVAKRPGGRKRHLLDSRGLRLTVMVTSASVQDRLSTRQVLEQARRRSPVLGP